MKCQWFICISYFFFFCAFQRCESAKILDKRSKGVCECGVFEKKEILLADKAIIQQTPMNVTCDAEGNGVCQTMCKALAEAARAKGPTLLCASILNVNGLKVSLFSRSCFDKNWMFTNLTSPEPICCHDGEPILCVIDSQ